METSTRYNGVDIKNLYRSTRELKITDRAIPTLVTGEAWTGQEFVTSTNDGFYFVSSIAKAKRFIDAALMIGCEVADGRLMMGEEQHDVCIFSNLHTVTAEELIARVADYTVAAAKRVAERAARNAAVVSPRVRAGF